MFLFTGSVHVKILDAFDRLKRERERRERERDGKKSRVDRVDSQRNRDVVI